MEDIHSLDEKLTAILNTISGVEQSINDPINILYEDSYIDENNQEQSIKDDIQKVMEFVGDTYYITSDSQNTYGNETLLKELNKAADIELINIKEKAGNYYTRVTQNRILPDFDNKIDLPFTITSTNPIEKQNHSYIKNNRRKTITSSNHPQQPLSPSNIPVNKENLECLTNPNTNFTIHKVSYNGDNQVGTISQNITTSGDEIRYTTKVDTINRSDNEEPIITNVTTNTMVIPNTTCNQEKILNSSILAPDVIQINNALTYPIQNKGMKRQYEDIIEEIEDNNFESNKKIKYDDNSVLTGFVGPWSDVLSKNKEDYDVDEEDDLYTDEEFSDSEIVDEKSNEIVEKLIPEPQIIEEILEEIPLKA